MERGIVWLIAAGVMAFGLITAWAAVASSLPVAPSTPVVVSDVIAGWTFAVVGAALWARYRSKWIGGLAIAIGLALFLPGIRWFETSFTWTLGSVLADIHLVLLAWLILAFPSGNLDRSERTFVIFASVYFLVLGIAGHLFEEPAPGCDTCPSSLLLLRVDPGFNDFIWGVGQLINLTLIGVLVAMIIRKRRSSTPAGRRALSPVVWALGPIGLALVLAFVEPLVGFGDAGGEVVLVAERLALIVFPVALVVGVIRAQLDRARVAELAVAAENAITSTELEDLIGTALGDPTARLGFCSGDREELIDVEGRRFLVGETQVETPIHAGDGSRLGVILHDPAVEPGLIESVSAAATLALRNESLRAELRRQLIEVERSRERITEAAMEERRRIERDLHDGAQQGLLALGATLSSIRSKVDGEASGLLDEAVEDLKVLIDDVRELARGVHPTILTDRGLAPAIEMLAERSPVPVRVDVVSTRFRPGVEAAAYFLVAEALANTARHANATVVSVRIARAGGALVVEVDDDGRGGADPEEGTGLQGLEDRVAALGGSMQVVNPRGGGTTLRAVLPCE